MSSTDKRQEAIDILVDGVRRALGRYEALPKTFAKVIEDLGNQLYDSAQANRRTDDEVRADFAKAIIADMDNLRSAIFKNGEDGEGNHVSGIGLGIACVQEVLGQEDNNT